MHHKYTSIPAVRETTPLLEDILSATGSLMIMRAYTGYGCRKL